jgi:hypothetical protein
MVRKKRVRREDIMIRREKMMIIEEREEIPKDTNTQDTAAEIFD